MFQVRTQVLKPGIWMAGRCAVRAQRPGHKTLVNWLWFQCGSLISNPDHRLLRFTWCVFLLEHWLSRRPAKVPEPLLKSLMTTMTSRRDHLTTVVSVSVYDKLLTEKPSHSRVQTIKICARLCFASFYEVFISSGLTGFAKCIYPYPSRLLPWQATIVPASHTLLVMWLFIMLGLKWHILVNGVRRPK